LDQLTPNSTYYPDLFMSAPNTVSVSEDYFGLPRNSLNTNVGAVELNEGLGLNGMSQSSFYLSPNPCQDEFQVSYPNQMDVQYVLVTDVFGKQLMEFSSYEGEYISSSSFKPGKYFVTLGLSNGRRTVLPLVVL